MSSLGLITEAFEPPETSLGLIKALNEYEEKVSPSIAEAIEQIVNHDFLEKTKDFTNSVIKPIEKLYKNINGMQESAAKEKLKQQLRFLLLVIENRLELIKLSKPQKTTAEKLFLKIHENIGSIPLLNNKVVQPDTSYLPKKYAASAASWAEEAIEDPQASFKSGKLGFIKPSKDASESPSVSTSKSSSARQQLFKEDEDEKSGKEAYALSYANGDFYPCKDLQADHFQPVENIVFRQMELIAAMNIDPLFREKIFSDKNSIGYFLTKKKKVFGTKKFFMDYYNCIDNLWLLNPAANSGTGKGSQGPLEWLSEQERYGEDFFNDIGGKDSISKDCILYTNKESMMLCAVAKAWFRQTYAEDIVGAGFVLHRIKIPAAEMITEARKNSSKRQRLRVAYKMAIAESFLAKSPSPSKKTKKSSGGSTEKDYEGVSTPDTRLTKENFVKIRKSVHAPAMQEAKKNLISEFTRSHPGYSGPKKSKPNLS